MNEPNSAPTQQGETLERCVNCKEEIFLSREGWIHNRSGSADRHRCFLYADPAERAVAGPRGDAESLVKKWIATLQDESRVTDEDAEDLTLRIIAFAATAPPAPAESDSDGWVTFGRVKVDIENETEIFERIEPPVTAPADNDAESSPRLPEIGVWGAHGEWPLTDVLTALTYAVEHLLQDHDCDRHGYEQLSYAIPAARWYVEQLTTTKEDR